jgi:hypothetical protein
VLSDNRTIIIPLSVIISTSFFRSFFLNPFDSFGLQEKIIAKNNNADKILRTILFLEMVLSLINHFFKLPIFQNTIEYDLSKNFPVRSDPLPAMLLIV